MKASFFKRICAFLLDYFIVIFIVSLITMGFNNNGTNEVTSKMNKLMSDYQSGEITIDEYKNENYKLNYDLQKNGLTINIVSVTLYVGYFIVFATLNKGQTLGKKLLKVKVVNKDGDKPSIWNMLIRSLFIYNIVSALFSVIFINILSVNAFTYTYTILGYIEFFVIIVSFLWLYIKKMEEVYMI